MTSTQSGWRGRQTTAVAEQANRPGPHAYVAALCVGIPGALVALVFGVSGAVALVTGQPLIWPAAESTLSEAVALRDQGEVIRQIMLGGDPNRRYAVNALFRPEEHVSLTPLEAAVITRELHMVELVVDYGATVDGNNGPVLQCLADGMRAESVKRYLIALSPEVRSCDDVELPWKP